MTVRVLSTPNPVSQGGNATLGTVSVAALTAPSAAKVWGYFHGTNTGTITAIASYGVGSIVRAGTGTYNITFATPFANTAYAFLSNASQGFGLPASNLAGSITILSFSTAGAAADSAIVTFVAFSA